MSYMEMIFIDSDDQALKTGVGAAMDTAAATWAAFRSYRRFAVDKDSATFLLDYYNKRGDLADTICLDDDGFVAITGERPKDEAQYRAVDDQYWRDARTAPRGKEPGK